MKDFEVKEIIINITKRCPYFCSFCLLDAIPYIYDLRSTPKDEIPSTLWIRTLETLLNTSSKIENIDISGGDPLFYTYTRNLVKDLLEIVPHEVLSISTTGKNYQVKLRFLDEVDYKGEIELTVDTPPEIIDREREKYNESNYLFAKTLIERGYKVTIVTVLRKDTIIYLADLMNIIENLSPMQWAVIPYYAVGRGIDKDLAPTTNQLYGAYLSLVRFSQESGIPVKFQHSTYFLIKNYLLKHLNIKIPHVCEIPYQIGILPNGDVVFCPWGLNRGGKPFSWNKIGNIAEELIESLLKKRAKIIKENFEKEGFNFCRARTFIRNKSK